MENRKSKVIDLNSGILESGTGATSGIVLCKNGVLRIRKLKVKRPNQNKGRSDQ
jgi:hypothetical protein